MTLNLFGRRYSKSLWQSDDLAPRHMLWPDPLEEDESCNWTLAQETSALSYMNLFNLLKGWDLILQSKKIIKKHNGAGFYSYMHVHVLTHERFMFWARIMLHEDEEYILGEKTAGREI